MNSMPAANIRLKEILKRRALFPARLRHSGGGNQTVVLLSNSCGETNSGARTQVKDYGEYVTIMTTPLTVDYKPEINKIYLSASMWWEHDKKYVNWADTLTIEK